MFWAKGGVDNRAHEQMANFNAPPEIVEKLKAQAEAENTFELFDINWPVVEMFLRVDTQWVIKPMGGILGLNYQSIDFAFKIYKVENMREIFEGLKVMEGAILRHCEKKE